MAFANTRLSYKSPEGLQDVNKRGLECLELAEAADQLQERWEKKAMKKRGL